MKKTSNGFVLIIVVVLAALIALGAAAYVAIHKVHPSNEEYPSSAVATSSTTAKNTAPNRTRIYDCPEYWFVDHMPQIITGPGDSQNMKPIEYFVYHGVRHELSEFDVEWVKSHCPVRPSGVF